MADNTKDEIEEIEVCVDADVVTKITVGDDDLAELRNEEKDGDAINWNNTATKELINLKIDFDDEFLSPKFTKRRVWEKIAERLTPVISVNALQAENKWKSLSRRYKKVVGNDSESGKDWIFLKPMQLAMKDSTSMKPIWTISSVDGSRTSSCSDGQFASASKEACCSDDFDVINWTVKAAKALIILKVDFHDDFLSPKFTKKRVWENIAERLTPVISVNALQAENKWKSLLRRYKKVVGDDSESGKDWVFLKPMELAIKDSMNVNSIDGPKTLSCSDNQFASASKEASCSDDAYVINWKVTATKALINLKMDFDDDFSSPKFTKKRVWENIAEKLRPVISVNALQAENKWKSLLRRYRKIVGDNSESGKDWVFLKQMQLAMKDSTSVKPTWTMNSIDDLSTSSSSERCSGEENGTTANNYSEELDVDVDVPLSSVKGKKRRFVSKNDEVVALFKELAKQQKTAEETRRKCEEKKIELFRQMHREKMELLKQLLEVLKNKC